MFLLIVSIALAAQCPKTEIVNYTNDWNKQDKQTFARAKKRCSEIYSDAPCLKKFIKKDENTYNAVCGA